MAAYPAFVQIKNGWPTIDIGRMRHSITIQAQTLSSPPVFDAGGVQAGWAPFAIANAAIEILRGTDVVKGGQTATQLFLTVGMWYQAGITPEQRVLSDNGSIYVIQSVENILELNVVLVLNCLALGSNQ